jgi:hypothetical protein
LSVGLAVFNEVAVIDPAVLVCLAHLPGFRAGLSVLAVAEHTATTFGNANVRRDLGVMGGTRRLPVWRKLPLACKPWLLDGRCEDGPQKRYQKPRGCQVRALGLGPMPFWTAPRLILAPQLPTLVDLLFQPSLNGLSAVSHMAAHPVADGAVALAPPAIQGVNGDAQHFRDILKRHQLVTTLECHDHLPFPGLQAGCALGAESPCRPGRNRRRSGKRPDRSTGRGLATVKDLSREATAGGRRPTTRIGASGTRTRLVACVDHRPALAFASQISSAPSALSSTARMLRPSRQI